MSGNREGRKKKNKRKIFVLKHKTKRGKERLYMIKTCRTPIEGGG